MNNQCSEQEVRRKSLLIDFHQLGILTDTKRLIRLVCKCFSPVYCSKKKSEQVNLQ